MLFEVKLITEWTVRLSVKQQFVTKILHLAHANWGERPGCKVENYRSNSLFVHTRCPVPAGAHQTRFYTGFLQLSSSATTWFGQSLLNTHTTVLKSTVILWHHHPRCPCSKCPCSRSCYSSLSTMPDNGRVSQRR